MTPTPTAATPAKRTEIANIYPLSSMQEGLLFHSLLSPRAGTYIPQVVLTLAGQLEGKILYQAWQMILARHDSLRTGFYWEQRDQPFQVVYRQLTLPWVEQDWQQLSPADQAAKLESLLACNRSEPFNLNQPPLMRLTWVQLGGDRYHLIWCYHHLILDGWSTSQVLKDVFHQYFVLSGRLPSGTLSPPRPYGDYIAWLHRQDTAAAQNFWKTVLDGWQGPQSLPMLKTGPADRATTEVSCSEQRYVLTVDVTQRLRAFIQGQQLTLNTLMQGALGLLLSRYCDSHDVVFGATCAGRPAALSGALAMVGLFINTLPVRVQIDPHITIGAWLQSLKAQQVETTAYDYVSLRDLQTWSNQGNPLFDCLLVFESYPVATEMFQGQTAFQVEDIQFNEWTHFPLTLLVSEGEQLTLTAKYRPEHMAAAAITRLLDHWHRLMVALADHPQGYLPDISLLSPAEQQQLVDWNQTAVEYPLHRSLAELLAVQAQQTPDAIAILCNEQSLTYQDLHYRAGQLARTLQHQGIGREDRVAIYLERSVAMVVAILAVVTAGAAYVPLEPSYPLAQLQWMLGDAGVSAVLVDQTLDLPLLSESVVSIEVSGGGQPLAAEWQPPLPVQINPENSLYVIYTSGSTGRPKGVINTHRGLVNRLLWMQDAYGLIECDRILHKTPLSFDVSVWELFWPLLNGATLVIAQPGGHKDSAYLVQTIRQQQITTLHFVPSMLAVFLDDPEVSACTSLRRVICSGEALPPLLQQQFFAQLPHTELHNLYGPTEAAIDVTAWQCHPDETTVPIGRPIANTQIHLLDRDHNPVPIGIPGELYIGGVGVARGYLNRPQLTAEKFGPAPLTSISPGCRTPSLLYQTGDLARYRGDGALEFLGRRDFQVKLRGMRIELGAIEAALADHPQLRQVAVVLREDLPGGPALVAYVVGMPVATPEGPQGLTAFLRQRLPEGLIPQAFVTLAALPLGPNGKLDRRALPQPERAGAIEQVPPRNPTEVAIATIWTEILQVQVLSIHDNFFALGGHSLSATRANTRLRQQFDLDLPLHSLFEYPTLEALAVHIDALGIATQPAVAPAGHKEIEL